MAQHKKPTTLAGGINYFVAFLLLFILLFSAVITLLSEILSPTEVFGPIFTSDGRIREVPAFFLIFLIIILYIIFWGYLVLTTNYLRIRFSKDFRQLRTPVLAHIIKIFGTFGLFLLLGFGLIFQGIIIIFLGILLAILCLYAILLYIHLSSNSIFNTIKRLPVTKKWSERFQARILFWLSIIMLLRLFSFDLSAIIDFLNYIIPLLEFPTLAQFFDYLKFLFDSIYNWIDSFLSALYLDILYPLLSFVSTLESLLVKILVYSGILLLQMEEASQELSISETVAVTEASKEAIESTTIDTGYQMTDRIGTMVDQDLVKKSYFPDYHKVLASGRFWKMALGILVIFFIEGILTLVDIELNTTLKALMDFTIAFAVWCLVAYSSRKTLRRIKHKEKAQKYETKLKR